MFEQLPETNPAKNIKKRKAFVAAAAVHLVLVAGIILIQMAMPDKLGEFHLLTTLYMAPPLPPPALGPAPPPVRKTTQKRNVPSRPSPVIQQQALERAPAPREPDLIAPTAVPAEVPRIIDAEPSTGGVIGGLPGGVPGGQTGGAVGGILGGTMGDTGQMPAPAPPKGPVRLGGDVKQPKILHIVQPKYPGEARRGRIEGVVFIEATVTETGHVDKVKVISGHPLLAHAAAEAVQQWTYEPTYLNGQPVAVILTAKVTFQLAAGR
jgi:periplasmic protein TonB